MNSIFSRILALAATAWVAGLASATASDWVVLDASERADVPRRGEILADTHEIDLQAGHEIVVIHRDGTVLRIAGPFSGALGNHQVLSASEDNDTGLSGLGALSKLLTENDKLISTLGSTRDPEIGKRRNVDANPWEPFVGAVATYCVDRKEPTIRRQNTTNPVRVTLVSPDFKILEQVWPKGRDALPLELIGNRLPSSYDLFFSDRPGQSTLIVRPADQSVNKFAQIKWMAEVGCKAQALQMVDWLLGQHN